MFLITAVAPRASIAQGLPPIHGVGPILAVTVEPLSSVSQVRTLSNGNVLVHDLAGRRLLMFDSTLRSFVVAADTTDASAKAYTSHFGGMISYREDSTLFVDPSAVSMYVIDPKGRIARTMAAPPGDDAIFLAGGPYGTPGIDTRGRLVYQARVGGFMTIIRTPSQVLPPDSSMVVRMELGSRIRDTVGKFFVYTTRRVPVTDENRFTVLTSYINPIPWVNDWALLGDGRVAIVHGQEFSVDIYDENDRLLKTTKIAFDWQRLTDEAMSAILDSVRGARASQLAAEADAEAALRRRRLSVPSNTAAPRPAGVPGGTPINMTQRTAFVSVDELPDYRPPFLRGTARGDLDGNLWIRTTTFVNGGAVYYLIDHDGNLFDRVQVPPGRVIAGFGKGGFIYMGMLDGTIARLERAHVTLAPAPH
jgi:hypothetical protein